MILTGCVGLKDAFHGIDWNTIVVLACSQGFAKGMETSGAGQLIADTTLNVLGDKATVFVVLYHHCTECYIDQYNEQYCNGNHDVSHRDCPG